MGYTWKQWLHGLLAAVIGSFGNLGTTGVAGYFMDYDLADWNFWKPCIAGAIFTGWAGVKMYIAKFPPPGTMTDTIVTDLDRVKQIPGGTETTKIRKTETTERSAEPVTVPKET